MLLRQHKRAHLIQFGDLETWILDARSELRHRHEQLQAPSRDDSDATEGDNSTHRLTTVATLSVAWFGTYVARVS